MTDREWGRAARFWGLLSGVAFAVATLTYLVEALGLIGAAPVYAPSAAGQLHDEAVFLAASFAYRNATLWDYVFRDGLFFVAWLGFLPLLLAANAATGGRRAAVQIGCAFLGAAAIFGALNAVAFFVDVDFWRNTGWAQIPAEIMVAVGRGTQFFDRLSSWCGTAANAALVIALFYLGWAFRSEAALPRRLGLVAWAGAALCAASIVVGQIPDTEAIWNVLGLVTGVVVAPTLAIGLGLHLARGSDAHADGPR